MRSVSVALLLAVCIHLLPAQQDVRTAARSVALLAVEDAGLQKGVAVRVGMQEQTESAGFREGIIEGLLDAGCRVLRDDSQEDASVELSFVLRGPIAGHLKVSVLAVDNRDGQYILSRAYAIPIGESSLLESIVSPVIVAAAAVLVVYLLLTVRSS